MNENAVTAEIVNCTSSLRREEVQAIARQLAGRTLGSPERVGPVLPHGNNAAGGAAKWTVPVYGEQGRSAFWHSLARELTGDVVEP